MWKANRRNWNTATACILAVCIPELPAWSTGHPVAAWARPSPAHPGQPWSPRSLLWWCAALEAAAKKWTVQRRVSLKKVYPQMTRKGRRTVAPKGGWCRVRSLAPAMGEVLHCAPTLLPVVQPSTQESAMAQQMALALQDLPMTRAREKVQDRHLALAPPALQPCSQASLSDFCFHQQRGVCESAPAQGLLPFPLAPSRQAPLRAPLPQYFQRVRRHSL